MKTQLLLLASALGALGASALNTTLPIYPYRNASLCVEERVEDLLSRMTLEEKAGQMFQLQIFMGPNNTFDPGDPSRKRGGTVDRVTKKFMTHFNMAFATEDTRSTVEFVNRLQKLAIEKTRLGIPITLSTDPRHAFQDNVSAGLPSGIFSQWPETIGLAAIQDPELVRQFGEIAREEYNAIGIKVALHPQVDLSTEPRWSRTNHGFGEDATLTSDLLTAYIRGFQGDTFGSHSVSTVTKHFPGGGASANGEDSHFEYGQNSSYPGNNFEYHLKPFKAALAAGTRQMMPYYSRPVGLEDFDSVGWAFNKRAITELLRGELGFDGIILSDWSIITGSSATGDLIPPRAWGVQHLTELERAAMVLDAGCDQIGGEERPDIIIELVKQGIVTEERIDQSVRRLLREKFLLGLFENPLLDVEQSVAMTGNAYFKKLGRQAQRKAYTLLSNKDSVLPLRPSPETKFFIEGFNKTYMEARNLRVVATPEEADIALLRLPTPFEPRNGTVERHFHAGSLEYPPWEKERQATIYGAAAVTIVDVLLERPAVIPEVIGGAAAVLGSYGSGADAFLDIIFGDAEPQGKLPFDLPRTMEAVEANMGDVPFDTRDPLFKFGHGLRYPGLCGSKSGVSCA
ncbi:glycosyl hydrolase family 3 N terminal domain-containing protein [Plectosphaerella plurivora]|uniref:beta-glucosidase n=1 Tax=Plectosphaerella plurivora TaxID=936078 RepID=A0A9P9ABQ0_9PEZI|nr:glycosyl hydrolase family 3 N terminal domain-containing protein [Plectosphaerella plurivora]